MEIQRNLSKILLAEKMLKNNINFGVQAVFLGLITACTPNVEYHKVATEPSPSPGVVEVQSLLIPTPTISLRNELLRNLDPDLAYYLFHGDRMKLEREERPEGKIWSLWRWKKEKNGDGTKGVDFEVIEESGIFIRRLPNAQQLRNRETLLNPKVHQGFSKGQEIKNVIFEVVKSNGEQWAVFKLGQNLAYAATKYQKEILAKPKDPTNSFYEFIDIQSLEKILNTQDILY